MTTTPEIAALLDHEGFVRGLARSLVSDRAAADDLAQDTWLAALRSPPRALGSLRGWLAEVMRNQLRNRRRGEARRRTRETAVARGEADGGGRAMQEQLALQHRVVEAVLALREPHRTVILLRYYRGLTSAQIARQRGVPAGTVRSQLSRGLEELRAALDRVHGGDRAAWSALLAPFLDRAPAATGVGAKVAAAAAMLVAAAIAVPALGWLDGESAAPPVVSAPDVAAAPRESGALAAPAAAAPEPRTAVASPAAPQDPDPRQRDLPDLLRLAAHTQALLRQRLLTPDEARVSAELALLPAGTKHGATRILRSEIFCAGNAVTGIRGGGAYYSFHLDGHSYNDEPDLGLTVGEFSSSFYGGTSGFFLELGDVPLASLDASAPPPGITQQQAEQWDLLGGEVRDAATSHDSAFDTRADAVGSKRRVPARVGCTYLLRSVMDGQHDILVAFRSVHADRYGHTLVYRVLRTFGSWGQDAPETVDSPREPPPAWLTRKTVPQLLDYLGEIRAAAEPRLLAVPEAFARTYRAFAAQDGQDICRLLHRFQFDSVMQSQEAGAYFSFVTEKHDYQQQPDISLEQGAYGGGFAGMDRGYLLDLGAIPLDQADRMPQSLDERGRRAWRFLHELTPKRTDHGPRIADEDLSTAIELGIDEYIPAVLGHTYLLRSVQEHHDVLVAFSTLAMDEQGHTLLWRVLERR